jgi:hypothetical protein
MKTADVTGDENLFAFFPEKDAWVGSTPNTMV